MQLEDLQANAAVRGILAEALLAVHTSLVEPLPRQPLL